MDAGKQLARSHNVGTKVATIFQKRAKVAQEQFSKQANEALNAKNPGKLFQMMAACDPWSCYQYAIDAAQRAILFWDTMRQRGNQSVENTAQGYKPVLNFEYDTIMDGRTFERPVNYALLRIKPHPGVTIDAEKRPYLIIDPRAGHGPGIGGFKDDSQVGVAMRAGHPVYFVIFFRDPEPDQTMLDVCAAEERFVKKVRELHPNSDKPAIVGNCQGGWAAMMLASSSPNDTGPIVINGAPMSYWGGAWSSGESDNPMRYSGGILGGTWLASLYSDLGNGKFDGAYLVQNFEGLNPANTYWDKQYNLYENIDTEPPRYLEFERWWGGYYLMNREEIEWITRNLFVGNKLWTGDVKSADGKAFDLRDIRSPIVLFASMGDNITPPQQAFNWVADIYGSTEEIKARGQVIVGLTHKSVGHLGIFVSGKVAKKEHAQIVSVLESIEALPPGLYGMEIKESKGQNGEVVYSVDFHEHRLEDIAAYFNRFKRVDEKPFEAVVEVSDLNQRIYEMFAQPFVQAMSNEYTANLMRQFHPLRFQQWAVSDVINPWMAWLAPVAQAVKANRRAADNNNPVRKLEKVNSDMISGSLEYYRAMRDAASEATFFSIYANMFNFYLADKSKTEERMTKAVEKNELPVVKEALASIAEGGYAEAFARVAFLLRRKGDTLSLPLLNMRAELAKVYADYLPPVSVEEWHQIRGEQEIIARYEPEEALRTLPALLADRADRKRLLTLLDNLLADERVQDAKPSPEQLEMVERIRSVLNQRPARERHPSTKHHAAKQRATTHHAPTHH
jgi:pimeloyl-ACP methyl ester carboxylesterase